MWMMLTSLQFYVFHLKFICHVIYIDSCIQEVPNLFMPLRNFSALVSKEQHCLLTVLRTKVLICLLWLINCSVFKVDRVLRFVFMHLPVVLENLWWSGRYTLQCGCSRSFSILKFVDGILYFYQNLLRFNDLLCVYCLCGYLSSFFLFSFSVYCLSNCLSSWSILLLRWMGEQVG